LKIHGFSYEALDECIIKIVSRNLISGRAKHVIDRSEAVVFTCQDLPINNNQFQPQETSNDEPQEVAPGLVAYIDRVITTYHAEHPRVVRLERSDAIEWALLFEQLRMRAYHALLRRQTPTAKAREEAVDFAQETCHAVFSSPFPYDVPFDAWTTKILNNFILQRYTRSRDLIDRKPMMVMSLDQPERQTDSTDGFSFHDLLTNEADVSAFKQIEIQEWLVQAIRYLRSQAQQEVIIYSYFYDLSDEEIAKRLDKSTNAVYILRHRALHRLQEILGEEVKERAI